MSANNQPVPASETNLSAEQRIARDGVIAALGAYGFWGFVIIFYKLLVHVPALEIIAHRIVWTVVMIGVYLLFRNRLGELYRAYKNPKLLAKLALASVLVGTNWLIFIWAVTNGMVLETSFGYFINPLVNVAIGVFFLSEKLSKPQLVAVGIATFAVIVQATALDGFPWIALSLAGSFGFYGFVRKKIDIAATPGLFVEASTFLFLALGYLVYLEMQGMSSFTTSWNTAGLLALTGVTTAIPLILFGAATRRIQYSTIGLIQYLAPTISFFLAIYLYGEEINNLELFTFVLIWISLAIYTTDAVRQATRKRVKKS